MLNANEVNAWISENGTGHKEWKYINGISYLFATMNDGWIAVFETHDGIYIPRFQAADEKHAISRCSLSERPNVPFNVFPSNRILVVKR